MSEMVQTRLFDLQDTGFIASPMFDKKIRLKDFSIKAGEVFVVLEQETGEVINERMDAEDCSAWVDQFKGIEPIAKTKLTAPVVEKEKKGSDKTLYNIKTLRTHLFDMVQKLQDGTANADTAKAMASVAQTILNSAKLEIEYRQIIDKSNDKSIVLFDK